MFLKGASSFQIQDHAEKMLLSLDEAMNAGLGWIKCPGL